MSPLIHEPRAFFGGQLSGSAPVRHIYIDEAGISKEEPVTIVVGLIVHVDTQWLRAAQAFSSLLVQVPEKYRQGFIFHAKSIWGNPKYRDVWSFESRRRLLNDVMNLPTRLGMALSVGVVRRSGNWSTPNYGIPVEQAHHLRAFSVCIGAADRYIREECAQEEMATVVAEDVPEKRKFFRNVLQNLRLKPEIFSHAISAHTGIQEQFSSSVERIIDTVHFVEKTVQTPLLQIADACAFGLRRYFSNQSNGEEFRHSIAPIEFPHDDGSTQFSVFVVAPKHSGPS